MNNRERIINLVKGEPVDRKPFFLYFGLWGETVERWKKEGLALSDEPYAVDRAFGLDTGIWCAPIDLGYFPAFKEEIVEDRGDTFVMRNHLGILQLVHKHSAVFPHHLENPVKCREDWIRLRDERLNPDTPGRIPDNIDEWVRNAEKNHAVIQIGSYPYGLFGTLRDMIGVENLLYWFYDEPELIAEMMDYLTTFWLSIYEKALEHMRIDIIHIWEDMSGKSGPLISPAMIREFMAPNYRRIRDFADKHGIPIMVVDTDGNVTQMIEPFMEAGVNMMIPFEVQAGCDVVEYAKKYPDLLIMGGFDKRILWDGCGPEDIDRELERLKPLFAPGVKYCIAPDHLVSPETSLANFTYFVEKVKTML